MEIHSDIEKAFLASLIEQNIPVNLFLKNGIKLSGKIIGTTPNAIFLGEPVVQMIYKNYISTIVVPTSPV